MERDRSHTEAGPSSSGLTAVVAMLDAAFCTTQPSSSSLARCLGGGEQAGEGAGLVLGRCTSVGAVNQVVLF